MWIWCLAFFGFVVGAESKVVRLPIYPTAHSYFLQKGKYFNALKDYYKLNYYGNVSVGTPPQTFQVLINTGVDGISVPSKNCTKTGCSKRKRKYDSSLSSTYKPSAEVYTVTSVLGSFDGVYSFDNVHINGVEVKGMKIMEANNLVGRPKEVEMDGILGLAFDKLITKGPFNVILDDLFKQGLIERQMFSIYIKGCLNALEDVGSEIVFGGSVPAHYIPPLHYVPLLKGHTWSFIIDDVIIGGRSFCGEDRRGCKAIFNSATSHISPPENIADKVINVIGPHEVCPLGSIFDCNIVPKLPTIYFVINGVTIDFKPHEYIKKFDDLCIAPMGYGDSWVLGTLFNMKYYTEYDLDNNRIGFARAR